VTAPKGGTGKSSTALNMAAFLGLRLRSTGRSVCIVDANTQQADTGKYLHAYTPDITALSRDPSGQTVERIQEFLLRREELNLSALLGPALAIDASPYYINPGLYNRAVDLLRFHFDYIIIDSPVAELFHPMFMEFALPQADFIMVPISPNVATTMNTDAWLRNITQPKYAGGPGVDPAILGIVLNRFEDEIEFSEDQVQNELAGWNYIGAIPESKEWKAANNRGELVVTYNLPSINDAFSRILYYITKEPALMEGQTRVVAQKPSLRSRLMSAIGR
jgi:MinD-like ATPase involved in chromosome partitioning or flagellar assembly